VLFCPFYVVTPTTGWSKRYTASVLVVWKKRRAYSESVLRYERRHDLAGMATNEVIGERARERATANLAITKRAPDQSSVGLITASRCRASGEDTGAKGYHRR